MLWVWQVQAASPRFGTDPAHPGWVFGTGEAVVKEKKRSSVTLNTDGSCLGALHDYPKHTERGGKDRPDPQGSDVQGACPPPPLAAVTQSCLSAAWCLSNIQWRYSSIWCTLKCSPESVSQKPDMLLSSSGLPLVNSRDISNDFP